MPDVLAVITIDTIGLVVGAVLTVLSAVKAASLLGPDRAGKLMDNFREALLASQGETVIWKRRAESAEPRVEELELEVAELEKRISELEGRTR